MCYLSEDEDIRDFFGVTPLLSTSIRVTKKCNLRCKHCYAEGGIQKDKELTYDESCNVLKQLEELNVSDVFFTGGEPFIRKDMIDILAFANKCGFNAFISTNGHFIDEEMVERLKQLKLKMMQVSVDGPKDVHIHNRGQESWNDAMKALDNLIKSGVGNVTVGSVVLKDNDNLEELISFCVEKKIPLIALMLLIEAGRAENMSGPSPEQMQTIMSKVFKRYLECDQIL